MWAWLNHAYRPYWVLFGGGLAFRLLLGLLFTQPGYTDAYYYSNVAEALWQGRGFREDYIWNYLSKPLPPGVLNNPSSTYWMPLTSVLIYAAYLVAGGPSFLASQIPNMLISAALAPLAFYLCVDVVGRDERGRRYGWLGGALLIFCGPYAPRFVLPDNFAPFALFSSAFLICNYKALRLPTSKTANRLALRWMAAAGLCAGLAYLTRVDGVILLAVAGLAMLTQRYLLRRPTALGWAGLGLMALVFGLTIAPWLFHNWQATGQVFPGGGLKVLFWREYNDFFSYSRPLDLPYYLNITEPSSNWGLEALLGSKWNALIENVRIVGLGALFLFPLFLLGLFSRLPSSKPATPKEPQPSASPDENKLVSRPLLFKQAEFLPFVIYIVVLYLAMSLAFTFPSTRGSVFHSSGGLLPFIYLICCIGLDQAIGWLSKFSRPKAQSARQRSYSVLIVVAFALISVGFGFTVHNDEWDVDYRENRLVGEWMKSNAPNDLIMVPDAPAYWYVNHQPALAITSDPLPVNLELARRYGVRYFMAQPNHGGVAYLAPLLRGDGASGYILVATLGEIQLYRLA